MAVGQNPRYLFGVGYHPKVVFFRGFLGGHQGTGVLTHGHMCSVLIPPFCQGTNCGDRRAQSAHLSNGQSKAHASKV